MITGTCNSGQIAAMEAALAAPDLLLIQGPPGTSKTTIIAEICYQVALKGGRMLIASQSNLTVDNAQDQEEHENDRDNAEVHSYVTTAVAALLPSLLPPPQDQHLLRSQKARSPLPLRQSAQEWFDSAQRFHGSMHL